MDQSCYARTVCFHRYGVNYIEYASILHNFLDHQYNIRTVLLQSVFGVFFDHGTMEKVLGVFQKRVGCNDRSFIICRSTCFA
jgi:hypothetical protein